METASTCLAARTVLQSLYWITLHYISYVSFHQECKYLFMKDLLLFCSQILNIIFKSIKLVYSSSLHMLHMQTLLLWKLVSEDFHRSLCCLSISVHWIGGGSQLVLIRSVSPWKCLLTKWRFLAGFNIVETGQHQAISSHLSVSNYLINYYYYNN